MHRVLPMSVSRHSSEQRRRGWVPRLGPTNDNVILMAAKKYRYGICQPHRYISSPRICVVLGLRLSALDGPPCTPLSAQVVPGGRGVTPASRTQPAEVI